ncbi:MAG TPA: hypothetical protein VFE62_07260, partial [Gemmataceae bacterium]|nr:hypothetical protein [Gemmataceae bacterium]
LRTGRRRPAALGVFVLAFAWCVLFFSLSGCKRPAYVLPAFPLLALMLGTFVTHGLPWQRWLQSAQARQRWAHRLAFAGIAMGVTLTWAVALAGLAMMTAAIVASMLFGVAGLGIWMLARRGPAWTSSAHCVAIMAVVLLMGQYSWLPAYHERFGLRRQVEIASEYEQEEPLPIISFPKRWDSIGFYTHREVIVHASDIDSLLRDLKGHREVLIFVRRESLESLRGALPTDLEWQSLGSEDDFIVVGVVRRREP